MASTIKDIAKKLKVSVSTVSYALNGGPRSVPEDVKRRVLAAAQELDYRPNRLAKSLVTRRMDTVGIVFDRTVPNLILSPFQQFILNAILNALEEHKLDALLTTAVEEDGKPQVARLLDGRVDGHIVLSPLIDDRILSVLDQRRIPFVTIAGGGRCTPDLSADNGKGIAVGLDHLMSQGHRRIAFVEGLSYHRDSIERTQAFRAEASARGLETHPHWSIPGNFTEEGGMEAASAILSQPPYPTAIFCSNDESARGALRVLTAKGIRVPTDVSLLGFDDLPIAQQTEPKLTTIRQPLEEMGRAAVNSLLQLMEGQTVHSQRFGPCLVQRGSTACPPENIHS
jgi:LacI family transcriptional regulator